MSTRTGAPCDQEWVVLEFCNGWWVRWREVRVRFAVMIHLNSSDEAMPELRGAALPSSLRPGVVYHVEHLLGAGGMGSVFFANRIAPEGRSLTVVKVLHPWFVAESGKTAKISFQKEVTALRRMQQHVPPNPFVVRYLDTGALTVSYKQQAMELPWVVTEYVHGGVSGTTLKARIEHEVASSGHAFGALRALRAIRCLQSGLSAIHEVGIIHRDMKPENILCCGMGRDEIFKITDFGVARPLGIAATFGNVFVGTPGYAAPEQSAADGSQIGAWSDIFALGAIAYVLLTGQEYFEPRTPAEALLLARNPLRHSLLRSPHVTPELSGNHSACQAIDKILARATAYRPAERPATAEEFVEPLVAVLQGVAPRKPPEVRATPLFAEDPTTLGNWSWTVLHRPQERFHIRNVAWAADGRCLAATSEGLAFWDGTSWLEVAPEGYPDPRGVRFVRRLSPGQWMIGGDGATLAVMRGEGRWDVFSGEDRSCSFTMASGDFEDLGVVLSEDPRGQLALYAIAAGRWWRPLPLPEVAAILSIARISDDRWILAGRKHNGSAFAGLYRPTQWSVEELPATPTRAYLGCAGQPERGLGLVVGVGGHALVIQGTSSKTEYLGASTDLAAATLDGTGRAWAAARGSLWLRSPQGANPWSCVWSDTNWPSPIVSVLADVGLVLAVSVDGSVLEGRLWQRPPGA